MHRVLRSLAPLAIAASLAIPVGAHATETLAYTFTVPCTGGIAGSSGLGLPTGIYAFTVTGVCVIDLRTQSQPVGNTPCSVPVAGTIPCTQPITTVDNVPVLGQVVTGGRDVATNVSANAVDCTVGAIRLDNICFASAAGTYFRTISGGMTAQFVDTNYADNAGELLVTVVWTPL